MIQRVAVFLHNFPLINIHSYLTLHQITHEALFELPELIWKCQYTCKFEEFVENIINKVDFHIKSQEHNEMKIQNSKWIVMLKRIFFPTNKKKHIVFSLVAILINCMYS